MCQRPCQPGFHLAQILQWAGLEEFGALAEFLEIDDMRHKPEAGFRAGDARVGRLDLEFSEHDLAGIQRLADLDHRGAREDDARAQ